ncbi:MAG: hypothetical protein M3Y70_09105 [Pseudomonadota bacterium]|nr:hypothetical protein [Pseudomonadota bacterium]
MHIVENSLRVQGGNDNGGEFREFPVIDSILSTRSGRQKKRAQWPNVLLLLGEGVAHFAPQTMNGLLGHTTMSYNTEWSCKKCAT